MKSMFYPLARHYVDPTWISEDWYLNQPPSYRMLFEFLFGNLIVAWGFLATSIIGRLVCYGLVALGLVLTGRKLGLNLPLLLLTVSLFNFPYQSLANEVEILATFRPWIAGGLVLTAIGLILTRRKVSVSCRYRCC